MMIAVLSRPLRSLLVEPRQENDNERIRAGKGHGTRQGTHAPASKSGADISTPQPRQPREASGNVCVSQLYFVFVFVYLRIVALQLRTPGHRGGNVRALTQARSRKRDAAHRQHQLPEVGLALGYDPCRRLRGDGDITTAAV